MKMYEVGGCVRDEILGVRSKDIDFSCVLDRNDLSDVETGGMHPFKVMVRNLELMGFKIFLENPEFLTVRAQFPSGTGDFDIANLAGGPAREGRKRLTADFVLARKEADYTDGRRPDVVEPGTLMDDLSRRDLTINAIAKDSDGTLIDPFNGVADIESGVIRAVGDAFDRLNEDALRAVRALRFSVTLVHRPVYVEGQFGPAERQFLIDQDLRFAMESASVLDKIRNNVSDERISDELSKMFRFDTLASLQALQRFPLLTEAIFSGRVNLEATLKQKGRGK